MLQSLEMNAITLLGSLVLEIVIERALSRYKSLSASSSVLHSLVSGDTCNGYTVVNLWIANRDLSLPIHNGFIELLTLARDIQDKLIKPQSFPTKTASGCSRPDSGGSSEAWALCGDSVPDLADNLATTQRFFESG